MSYVCKPIVLPILLSKSHLFVSEGGNSEPIGDGEDDPGAGEAREDGGSSGVSMELVGGIAGGIILLAIIVVVLVVYFRRHGCVCIGAGKEDSIYETVKPNAKLGNKKESFAYNNNAYDNMPNINLYDNVPAPIPVPGNVEDVYEKLEKPKLDPRNNSFANMTYASPAKRLYPTLSKETLKQAVNKEMKATKGNDKPEKKTPLTDNDVNQEVNTVNELQEKSQRPPYPQVVAEDGKLPPKT